MTWIKLGSEFFPECMHHGLPDAAVRTHAEAIAYIYEVEEMSCRIPKRMVRTFAGSEDFAEAIEALLAVEWWKSDGQHYELLHHADVIRQSLAAQQKKRDRDKKAQRTHRSRAENSTDGTSNVSADVSADVSGDADRQTDKHLGGGSKETCEHGKNTAWWKCEECDGRQTA